MGINSSGQSVAADIDTGPVKATAVTVNASTAAGDMQTLVAEGIAEDSSWSWTPGAEIYASPTAGGFTATRPTSAGHVVQPIGVALSATRIKFNIAPSSLVVQAPGNSTVAFG